MSFIEVFHPSVKVNYVKTGKVAIRAIIELVLRRKIKEKYCQHLFSRDKSPDSFNFKSFYNFYHRNTNLFLLNSHGIFMKTFSDPDHGRNVPILSSFWKFHGRSWHSNLRKFNLRIERKREKSKNLACSRKDWLNFYFASMRYFTRY